MKTLWLWNHVSYAIQAVAETWSKVLGDEVGALATKIFFAVPPNCDIWGDDGTQVVNNCTLLISQIASATG